ncbi:assimilatory nitrate reductase (NADH) beta subunit [Saccharopolyspora kobensis]|uniref:Assimilatory nitrate reductase (NADH) beta subunit n=1 Tax=Saccharopolyspora kobensis TaxID=146035 RepID=A0A1H5XFP1_9PSEU|nr:FAD-dependent oxidoreductase [Saccharopolyspora kobensis]SEG10026.1 assimilatory nitrate reductase (NADH) beta subunit [Saccharopolyspora kobensis]SFE43982.1 assimilatory nitrate reductase electron transfer subunit [Saccharopolyspora kobensis]
MSRLVVIGNGPAAHRLVERLRARGRSGPIAVLGEEPHHAYNRVLLGSVLAGELPAEAVRLPDVDAEVRLGVTATGIDRDRRVVRTGTGDEIGYDVLVLATGSRPRLPEIPGLVPLRTLADCERIGGAAGPLAVLGGGVLGVEAARALVARGHEVTLVHSQPHLMERQLDPAGGRLLADRLGELGIGIRSGNAVAHRSGRLLLDSGEEVPARLVIACTGVVPETALAVLAGLAVRRGVVVDDQLRTSDPRIHAIGDCAEHDGSTPGSIASAWEQAEVLADVLCGGNAGYPGSRAVTRLKARGVELVSIGVLDGADAEVVTLSDPARGRYAKLALRDERIAGAVLLGFPAAIASVTQLHDRDLPVPADRLALLLGTPAAVPGELPVEAVICRCNNVTRKSLTAAWQGGARSVAELARATRATTGCGGCADDVASLCAALAERTEHQKEGVA